MPADARNRRKVKSPEDYLEKVLAGTIRDPTIGFQVRNGFEPVGVLKDYLPEDKQSAGLAAHMVWRNPYVDPDEPPRFRVPRDVARVRIATCQFQAPAVKSFEAFMHNVAYFVDVASDYRSAFTVFPGLFPLQLIALVKNNLTPHAALTRSTD